LARLLLQWFWIILPVKRVAVVTTISASAKQELLKYVRISPDHIKVVYVPISSAFSPSLKIFNKEKPTILQVGTKPNKNVARLAEALSGINCRLDIIGDVNEQLALVLKNSGVEYTASKNLSPQAIVDRYHQADILAFVSTYEGFGMPIVEANAVGRVVVTSNVLSMPEVAGNAAHLVDPFDVKSIRQGILQVMENDAYREKLIANGFENRKRFSASHIAEQYSAIYRSLYSDNSH
jgi:glycosyltransferase involved in cell wall biosynthesis